MSGLNALTPASLLDRTKDMDYCTIYADPPYPTSDTRAYSVRGFDWAVLADLLKAQRGAVEISGYANEWYLLGWCRVTRPALRRQISRGAKARMEVL